MAVTIKRKFLKTSSKKNVRSRQGSRKIRRNMKTVRRMRNMRGGGKGSKYKTKANKLHGLEHITVRMPDNVFKYIPKQELGAYIQKKEDDKKQGKMGKRSIIAEYDKEKKIYNYYSIDDYGIKGNDGKPIASSHTVDKAVYNHVSRTDLHKAFQAALGPKMSYEALKKQIPVFQTIKSAVDAALIKASLQAETLDSRAIKKIIEAAQEEAKAAQKKAVYNASIQAQTKEKPIQALPLQQISALPPLPSQRLARTSPSSPSSSSPSTSTSPTEVFKENPYVTSTVGEKSMVMQLLTKNKIPVKNDQVVNDLMEYFGGKGIKINADNFRQYEKMIIENMNRFERSQDQAELQKYFEEERRRSQSVAPMLYPKKENFGVLYARVDKRGNYLEENPLSGYRA